MAENKLKIALVQMAFKGNKKDSLAYAEERIGEAAENGAELVILPEMFCCSYRTSEFPLNAEPEGGEICTRMSEAARSNRVWLVAGSMPEADGGKVYNTSFVYDPSGQTIAKHRKVHLFDVSIPGGQHFQESKTLSAGDSYTAFDTPWGRMGLAICYDIRFPEMFRCMQKSGADFFILPACFNMTTGPTHWEITFKTRAIDYQGFTIGCSQATDPEASYVAYGHSICCSPFGNVLVQAGHEETIAYAELDLSEIDIARQSLPLMKQQRWDVYEK